MKISSNLTEGRQPTSPFFKRFFESIGVLTLSIIMVLLMAEGVVRIAFKPDIKSDLTVKKTMSDQELCKGAGDPYEKNGECYHLFDSFAKMNFSTYFGYVPTPGQSGRGYHTNSSTMRYNENLNLHKTKDEFRTFVSGGSTAWGAGVPQDQLYSAIAEKTLQKHLSNSSIKVISAGVGGYVSLHEILRYLLYIRPLAPDVWVMFTGWNDVYAGYRGRDYVLSPDMLDLHSAILAGSKDDLIMRERLFEATQESADTHVKQPLWGNYKSKLHWLIDLAIYKQSLQTTTAKESTPVDSPDKKIDQANDTVDMFLTNVSIAANIARRDGIKLVVMLQPSVYSTTKQLSPYELRMVNDAKSMYPHLESTFKMIYPILRQRLKEAAVKESFIFLDSDQAIAPEKRTVFADHVHFGDRGNTLIGNYLANSIENLVH